MQDEPTVFGIFGNIGGGTSAVAGVVKLLGISMDGHPKTLDDNALYSSLPHFRILNDRKGTWAFKHPLLTDHIEEIAARVNLKPIYVYRDPVAAAWRHDTKMNTVEMFEEHLRRQQRMMNGPDGLHLSYERIIRDRVNAVQVIADYVGKEPNRKAVDWLDPSLGYRRISEYVV